MKGFLGLLSGLLLMQSCLEVEQEIMPQDSTTQDMVEVRFNAASQDAVRSSVSLDESRVYNINVYAFRNGILAGQGYFTGVDEIGLTLPAGAVYNIYAVANVGRCEAPSSERDFIEGFSFRVSDVNMLVHGVPMSCASKGVHVGTVSKVVDLHMKRLAAKVNLRIEKSSLLEGLRVNSVRLCQSASVVRPFRWEGEGGSRAESEDEVMDGDYASAADLYRLNNGREVSFYTLENCQGILLPDNEDPELKVPMMIPGKDKVCSYLEIGCEFDGSGLLEGDVRYRIYLGLDDCTSFDVPGNACINISLMLTGEGLQEVSWKANADVSVRDGYVTGGMLKGMHGVYDLYVGESFMYEVTLADELLEYFDGDASGCSLVLMHEGKEIDGLEVTGMQADGCILQVEMMCVAPAEGKLYLCTSEGMVVGCVAERVGIRVPEIAFSEYESWEADRELETLTYIPECDVNGEGCYLFLYFVDRDGYNLNGRRSYGYDHTLFHFKDEGVYVGDEKLTSFSAVCSTSPREKGKCACSVRLDCSNSGDDHDENILLADIYGTVKAAYLHVLEDNYAISSSVRIGVGMLPVTLTLVDNGWAGYHDCQMSMKVDNPSELPLDVSVWELMATNSAYGAADSDYVEDALLIDHMDYMTGEFYNGEPPLYASGAGFSSERNEEGDPALDDGQSLVYPLEGISTDDLIKAVNYNRRGNGQMIHMVDVTVAGHKILKDDAVIVDQVSDGSSEYDYLYYSDESWRYRGAVLFSKDVPLTSTSDIWAYEYPNVTPGRLDRLLGRVDANAPVCISMLYSHTDGKASVMTHAGRGAQYGLTLGIEYSGTVNGYVNTHPQGTWYGDKNNYCSYDFSSVASGVPLIETGQFVWADDGILKSAMDGVYGFGFTDSTKPLGTSPFLHYAHPTDMELNMGVMVEGEKGKELYPFYINWENEYLEYYHVQDDVSYECALTPFTKAYSLSIIRHR